MKSLGTLAVFAVGSLCTIGVQHVYKNPEVKASITATRKLVKSLITNKTELGINKSAEPTQIEVTAKVVKEVMNG
jgi:hypothetical protein